MSVDRETTMSLTAEVLNAMSRERRDKVLGYEGDRSRWNPPPTTLWGRLTLGSEPSHLHCPGRMREFVDWCSVFTRRRITRCDHCGRTENVYMDY